MRVGHYEQKPKQPEKNWLHKCYTLFMHFLSDFTSDFKSVLEKWFSSMAENNRPLPRYRGHEVYASNLRIGLKIVSRMDGHKAHNALIRQVYENE